MNISISTWNVNSIRTKVSGTEKLTSEIPHFEGELKELIENEFPTIICFQETKCTKEEGERIFGAAAEAEGYKYRYWNEAEKSGYAGVAIWSKIKPTEVEFEIPRMFHLNKGRIILFYIKDLVIINTYVPNSGRDSAWQERTVWHNAIYNYLKLRKENELPTIWCGDLNVVRDPELDTVYSGEILEMILNDLSDEETGRDPNIAAGLTFMERKHLKEIEDLGYLDAYRELYPDKIEFSWWSYRRPKIGWRLDYFFVSKEFMHTVKSVTLSPPPKVVKGRASDHHHVTMIIDYH